MKTPLLTVADLSVAFGPDPAGVRAVDGVSLEIARGEIHGLVGESGAGKSTVGNALIGLIEPPGRIVSGEIHFEGRPLRFAEERSANTGEALRGRDVATIFQDPLTSLNPLFTIGDQLCEGLRHHLRLSAGEARGRALELLRSVGINEPKARFRQYPHQFSGGMRQRVVIAMALGCNPRLLVADEPTTALDVSVQAQVLELMRTLCKQRGVGVLLVTHDIGVVAETADRVTVMRHGRVVESGPVTEVLGAPRADYTRALIVAVPRGDRPGPAHKAGSTEARDPPMLALRGVSVEFGAPRALLAGRRAPIRAADEVSFSMAAGESLGLVGESGSGKSTLANVIVGLVRSSAGRVEFDGADITRLSESELRPFRRQMQMVFQDPYASLNARMRVRDIVAEPLRFHRLARGEADVVQCVKAVLNDVGLDADAADRYPHAFSGGQRQRISIARALVSRPKLLICDEPTSSLDVSIQAQILELLRGLREAYGLTLLLISHDLPVIRQMCDRVAVLRAGRICELAVTEALFENPQHEYTRHLLALMPRLPDGI